MKDELEKIKEQVLNVV
ncbi:MAG: hypothetical protein EXR21_01355 [Flavobacteriaceae bacterium]|nr:hypothetical protein [Flavobacteriaceae bacterium]